MLFDKCLERWSTLLSFLDLSLIHILDYAYEKQTFTYTEEEAKARALDKQKALLKTLEEKGVQILGNRVKIGIQKGVCTAKGTLAVVEKAGQQVPVQIPQEPAERNADVDE